MAAITGLSLYSMVLNDGQQIRLRARLGRAELANISAARKSGTGADQNDGLNGRIGVRPFDAIDDRLTQFQAQTIHGGIVEFEDGDAVLYLQTSLIHAHLLFHCSTLQNSVPSFWPANVTALAAL